MFWDLEKICEDSRQNITRGEEAGGNKLNYGHYK